MKTIKDYLDEYDKRTYQVLSIILLFALIVLSVLVAIKAAG